MENLRSSRLLQPIPQSRQLVSTGLLWYEHLGPNPGFLPTSHTLPLPRRTQARTETQRRAQWPWQLARAGRQSFLGKDGLSRALAGHAEVCLVTLAAMTSTQYLSDGMPVTSECPFDRSPSPREDFPRPPDGSTWAADPLLQSRAHSCSKKPSALGVPRSACKWGPHWGRGGTRPVLLQELGSLHMILSCTAPFLACSLWPSLLLLGPQPPVSTHQASLGPALHLLDVSEINHQIPLKTPFSTLQNGSKDTYLTIK